jgi:hypothetical protein
MQIIHDGNKPQVVILDYTEYLRLKEMEQDKIDYYSAIEVKRKNKRWTSHKDLK